VSPAISGSGASQQIVANWLESLARLGGFIIRISLPRLRVLMLSNPLKRVIFRNKAPDYFRFAIGPQNIDPPARSGIFPSHESWSLLEHPSKMRPRRPGSSQPSCHTQTDHRKLERPIGASAWAPAPRDLSGEVRVEALDRGRSRARSFWVMSNIPLDLERRCEQRWAARFSAARALRQQHRLERQQQLTAPDNSKRKTNRGEAVGLRSVAAACESGY
jgi:hypothetical protein